MGTLIGINLVEDFSVGVTIYQTGYGIFITFHWGDQCCIKNTISIHLATLRFCFGFTDDLVEFKNVILKLDWTCKPTAILSSLSVHEKARVDRHHPKLPAYSHSISSLPASKVMSQIHTDHIVQCYPTKGELGLSFICRRFRLPLRPFTFLNRNSGMKKQGKNF